MVNGTLLPSARPPPAPYVAAVFAKSHGSDSQRLTLGNQAPRILAPQPATVTTNCDCAKHGGASVFTPAKRGYYYPLLGLMRGLNEIARRASPSINISYYYYYYYCYPKLGPWPWSSHTTE